MMVIGSIEDLLASPPYRLKQIDKEKIILPLLAKMTQQHSEDCPEYGKIIQAEVNHSLSDYEALTDIPFIPVRLFKEYKLVSVSDEEIVKSPFTNKSFVR